MSKCSIFLLRNLDINTVSRATARYNAATFSSSFLIARLMKSLMVMPVEATNAATRECNSDGIRRFSLPL